MRRGLLLAVISIIAPVLIAAANTPVAPNGIAYFPEFMTWKVIAPSYREDKDHIRIITGNEIAVTALHNAGNPLPDGSVLAKVAWKAEKHPSFPDATVPGAFVQVEFMVKNTKMYKETGGWGFARFVGNELKPYGKDAGFVRECFQCHLPVAANDYLFTKIVNTPDIPVR